MLKDSPTRAKERRGHCDASRAGGGTLRGPAAIRFLGGLDKEDAQALMARVTGNYRRGNERAARGHSRNAGQ